MKIKQLLALLVFAPVSLMVSCSQSELKAMAHGGYMFGEGSARVCPNERVSSGYWDMPKGLTGPRRIEIDTRLQQAKYYVGHRVVGITTVSTGTASHATPRKTYTVLSKDATHRSSKYGSVVNSAGATIIGDFVMGKDKMPAGGKYVGAPMFNGMQLNTTGIWMHEGIVTSAPESHGCIRLPAKMAKIFFDNTPIGTPVIVK